MGFSDSCHASIYPMVFLATLTLSIHASPMFRRTAPAPSIGDMHHIVEDCTLGLRINLDHNRLPSRQLKAVCRDLQACVPSYELFPVQRRRSDEEWYTETMEAVPTKCIRRVMVQEAVVSASFMSSEEESSGGSFPGPNSGWEIDSGYLPGDANFPSVFGTESQSEIADSVASQSQSSSRMDIQGKFSTSRQQRGTEEDSGQVIDDGGNPIIVYQENGREPEDAYRKNINGTNHGSLYGNPHRSNTDVDNRGEIAIEVPDPSRRNNPGPNREQGSEESQEERHRAERRAANRRWSPVTSHRRDNHGPNMGAIQPPLAASSRRDNPRPNLGSVAPLYAGERERNSPNRRHSTGPNRHGAIDPLFSEK